VTIDMVCWIIAGCAWVYISKARSNDAHGHSKFAFLSFIPLGNLWLLFKGSKNINYNPNESQHLTSGWPAVVIALIVYFVGGLLSDIQRNMIFRNMSNPKPESLRIEIGKKFVDYYTITYGVPKALEYLKSIEVVGEEYPDGSKIDEITVNSNVITYKFMLPQICLINMTLRIGRIFYYFYVIIALLYLKMVLL
jgi:hypothetical protein